MEIYLDIEEAAVEDVKAVTRVYSKECNSVNL